MFNFCIGLIHIYFKEELIGTNDKVYALDWLKIILSGNLLVGFCDLKGFWTFLLQDFVGFVNYRKNLGEGLVVGFLLSDHTWQLCDQWVINISALFHKGAQQVHSLTQGKILVNILIIEFVKYAFPELVVLNVEQSRTYSDRSQTHTVLNSKRIDVFNGDWDNNWVQSLIDFKLIEDDMFPQRWHLQIVEKFDIVLILCTKILWTSKRAFWRYMLQKLRL